MDRNVNNSNKRGVVWPKILIAALIIVLVCAGAYAAYTRWSLPKPTQYEPGNEGIYDVHSESQYTQEDIVGTAPSEDIVTILYSDSYFITEAIAILELLGLDDVNTESMTVSRSLALWYDREEAQVSFEQDENNTSVTYNADTGMLISLSSIDWIESADAVCETDEQAEKAAEDYYKLLPVTQGYILIGCTKYDEQYWSYEYCREVSPGLYNAYEMVRIAINPKNGRLTKCNVFYFPLLDDHLESDEPLSQTQAEEIAMQLETVSLDKYNLKSAEITVVLPNWFFTDSFDANLQFSDVSRLAWSLTYENTDGVFDSIIQIDIDLYTGELLGGGTT